LRSRKFFSYFRSIYHFLHFLFSEAQPKNAFVNLPPPIWKWFYSSLSIAQSKAQQLRTHCHYLSLSLSLSIYIYIYIYICCAHSIVDSNFLYCVSFLCLYFHFQMQFTSLVQPQSKRLLLFEAKLNFCFFFRLLLIGKLFGDDKLVFFAVDFDYLLSSKSFHSFLSNCKRSFEHTKKNF
jgi:hypothetical protein